MQRRVLPFSFVADESVVTSFAEQLVDGVAEISEKNVPPGDSVWISRGLDGIEICPQERTEAISLGWGCFKITLDQERITLDFQHAVIP
jgi:hypothetical protein